MREETYLEPIMLDVAVEGVSPAVLVAADETGEVV